MCFLCWAARGWSWDGGVAWNCLCWWGWGLKTCWVLGGLGKAPQGWREGRGNLLLSQGGRCYSRKAPSSSGHLANRGVGSLDQTKTKPFIFLQKKALASLLALGMEGAVPVVPELSQVDSVSS